MRPCLSCDGDGRARRYVPALGVWEPTDGTCPACEWDHIADLDGVPCSFCGRPCADTGNRTGDPLCPACIRMESGEDEHAHRWDRDNQWQQRLGMEVGY